MRWLPFLLLASCLRAATLIQTDAISVGTGAAPVHPLEVNRVFAGSAQAFGIHNFLTLSPTATSSEIQAGIFSNVSIMGTQTVLGASSIFGGLTVTSSSPNTIGEAVLGHIQLDGPAARMNYLAGFRTSLDITAGAVAGDVLGLSVPQVDVSGGAIVTGNIFGVKVGDLTGAGKTDSRVVALSAGGNANSFGLSVDSSGAATSTTQRPSPWVRLQGSGYSTTLSAGRTVAWGIQNRPAAGTAPTTKLVTAVSIDQSAYADVLTLDSADNSVKAAGTIYTDGTARVARRVSPPASPIAAGKPGDFAADASWAYFYGGDGTTHSWIRSAAAVWQP